MTRDFVTFGISTKSSNLIKSVGEGGDTSKGIFKKVSRKQSDNTMKDMTK